MKGDGKSSEPGRPGVSPPAGLKGPELHDLGILFVHGIGTQREGDVVLQCGEAIHRWLDRWLARLSPEGPSAASRLLEARLSRRGSEVPAHARLVLGSVGDPDAGDGSPESSWLLAESHWAESFRAPSFAELLIWALVTLPRAVLLHSLNPIRSLRETLELRYRGEREGLVDVDAVDHASNIELVAKTFGGAAWLFVSPVVIVATLVSLAAVFALRLIPLRATRSLAGKVQRLLSATLGDSFLFSTSAMTRAAVVTRVGKDLDWLAPRCRKVAIVAHSQGAAVTYSLLQRLRAERRLPGNLVQFVTYGSGLRKLTDLEQADWPLARLTLIGWLAAGLAAALAFVAVRLLLEPTWWLALPLLLLPVVMTLVVTAASVLVERRPRPVAGAAETIPTEPPLPVDWLDLYASRDPVPNGPVDVRFWGRAAARDVQQQKVDGTGFARRSERVYNRHSMLGDHTAYWSHGGGDFIPRLLSVLAPLAGGSGLEVADIAEIQESVRQGRRRAWQLAGLRLAVPIVAVATLLWQRGALERFGQTAAAWLRTASGELPGLIAGPTGSLVDRLAEWPLALGFVGLGMALAAVCAIGELGWTSRRKQEIAGLLRPQRPRRVTLGLFVFWASWLSVIVLPLALASRWAASGVSAWPLLVGTLWALLRLAPGPRLFEGIVDERKRRTLDS